jgi:hypothetical protein
MNPSILYCDYKYTDRPIVGWEFFPFLSIPGNWPFLCHHLCFPNSVYRGILDPPPAIEELGHENVYMVPDVYRCGDRRVLVYSGRCRCGVILWTCSDLATLTKLCEIANKEKLAKLGMFGGFRHESVRALPFRMDFGGPCGDPDDAAIAHAFGSYQLAKPKSATVANTPMSTLDGALSRIAGQVRAIANQDVSDDMPEPDYMPRGE